uniref:GHKL domain-containing protein n=1 Tax=Agathobacter sp. TaxID=2021311 RepID=UPI004055E640
MNEAMLFIMRDAIVTGFQFWCLFILMKKEEARSNQRKFLMWAILTIVTVFCSSRGVQILIKMGIIILLIVVIGTYCYDCSLRMLTVYGFVLVLAVYCSEMVLSLIWNQFNEPVFSLNMIYDDFVLTFVIVANAIFFIFCIILSKVIKKEQHIGKMDEILPIIVSSIPFLLVLASIHISLPEIHESKSRVWFLISSIAVFIALVFNVIFTQHYMETIAKKREEQRALDELKLKNAYYMQKLETEEYIKGIYHDLKNYFIMVEDGAIDKDIQRKLASYERFYESGNQFLDIILADKISLAQEKHIRLECNVNFSEGDFINPLDISTIFGNLLDNAIEAAEKVPEEERYIFLNADTKHSLLIIVVRNKMNHTKNAEDLLKSGKWNKSFHGYGLSNIKKSLKKYNGQMKINICEGEFIVNIVVPYPTEPI